jgi:DNA-binding beta-propeller fold protein YncE
MKHTLICVLGLAICGSSALSQPTQPIGDAKVFRNDGVQFWHSFRAAGLANPSGIARTSDGAAFYIADYDSGTIYVFDTAGGCLYDFTPAGLVAPTGLALTPDDAALYVCSTDTNKIQVVDAADGSFLTDVTGHGLSEPADVAMTSDGAAIYVASRGTGDIKVFDSVGTFLFAFTAPGLDPTGINLTTDDATVYVASGASNTVEVFSCDGQHLGTAGFVNSPTDVTVALDDALLYVVSVGGNAVAVLDNLGAPLAAVPGVDPLNGRSQLLMGVDDASFAVSNFGRRPLVGDLNCDGLVDFGDINPFVLILTDPAGWQTAYPDCLMLNGDIDEDCDVDFGDINPFVALLSGEG